MIVRTATADDLQPMAALAAEHQLDDGRHCLYLSTDADAIVEEVSELDDWADYTAVAEEDGEIVGWLFGEPDPDMGRVWWWGPFAPDANWGDVADELYRVARALLRAICSSLGLRPDGLASAFEAAILMMSEAVPCMGALIAVRSAAARRWALRALISATAPSVCMRSSSSSRSGRKTAVCIASSIRLIVPCFRKPAGIPSAWQYVTSLSFKAPSIARP